MEAANDQKRQVKEVLQQKQMQQKEKRFRECNQIGQAKKKQNSSASQLRFKSPNSPTGLCPTLLEFW